MRFSSDGLLGIILKKDSNDSRSLNFIRCLVMVDLKEK